MSELELPVEQNEGDLPPVDPLTVSRRWLLLKVGALFNAVVGVAVTVPVVKYLLSPVKPDDEYKSWIVARTYRYVSCRRDSLDEVYKSSEPRMGWRNGSRRMLGTPNLRKGVSGVCNQLCAPGMSGSLVPSIAVVHVPLPWRGLLCGRESGFRAT